jgi:hypothetical protein
LLKGNPANGAHVVVKNTNGALVALCYTLDTGKCQVQVEANSYIIDASSKGRAGTLSRPVTDATELIMIKLAKVKSESSPPMP